MHGCWRRNMVKLRLRRLLSKGSPRIKIFIWHDADRLQAYFQPSYHGVGANEVSFLDIFLVGLHIRSDVSTFLGFKWSEEDEAGDLHVFEQNPHGIDDHTMKGEAAATSQARRMFICLFILSISSYTWSWFSASPFYLILLWIWNRTWFVLYFTKHLQHGVDGICI